MDKHKFPIDRIINVDESGITTVLPSPKVVAPTGVKQIGQCVSGERGELVTFCGIVTASGNALPPVYVYPRVHFKDYFMSGAPQGSIGFANRSGWMTQEIFLEVIKHVQKQMSASKDNPVLIILDNHESHISLDTIIYCRENGIILLTFPPHTSHRLQPLDVAVFAPFKSYCKNAFNKWISENPGKTINIYEIAKLSAVAFDESFSRKNILSGFKKTGISPLDRSVFKEDDFLCSIPTDHPELAEESNDRPTNQNQSDATCLSINRMNTSPSLLNSPSTSSTDNVIGLTTTISSPKDSSKISLTPEQVRPFPKSEKRKSSGKGRKKGKSCVLTDTPEKTRIELEVQERKSRSEKKAIRPRRDLIKRKLIKNKEKLLLMNSKKAKKTRTNKKTCEMFDSDSYSSKDLCEEEGFSPLELESDDEVLNDGELVAPDGSNISVNDFVLVKLASKKTVKFFVARIEEMICRTEFNVNFCKKKEFCFKFYIPDIPDISLVDISDIVKKLPHPITTGCTTRALSVVNFSFDFSSYNMG